VDALWYFAYGSNMSPAIFLGRRGMRPLAAQRARLDGFRLCFSLPVGPGERGVANLEPVDGAHVWGVAYLLESAECDRLDRTEGVPKGIYKRTPIVLCVEEERVEAFTYQSSFASAGRKPSLRYIGLLLDGARWHGLPMEYVKRLETLELAVDERLGSGQGWV
jgi:gliotoxin/aspirochlorine biosynthesis gamma-glutamylcyclotransferase